MSDTQPKKRPQRPAAPSWSASKKPRSDGEESPGGSPLAAPLGSDASPSSSNHEASSEPEEGARASQVPASTARIPASMVGAVPSKARPALGDAPRPTAGEPEAVSLSEIESMLSPGKAPPRLPGIVPRAPSAASAASAPRAVVPAPARTTAASAPRPGGPVVPRPYTAGKGATPPAEAPGPPRAPLDSVDDHEPVPHSARLEEPRTSDLNAMATLAASPRRSPPRTPRPAESVPPTSGDSSLPHGLESTNADLELMAAIAPAAPKKEPAPKPWAASKQQKGAVVAVLSTEATAALKGSRPAQGAAPTGFRAPPSPLGRPTPAPGERASDGDRPSVVIPAAPGVRITPARSDEVDDSAWGDESSGDRRSAPPVIPLTRRSTPPPPPVRRSTPPPPPVRRSTPPPPPIDPLAIDALQMRHGGSRASLPDPVELLRDATDPSRSTGRGSVVDPLELYGAAPEKTAAPAQPQPKVVLQPPPKTEAKPGGRAAEAQTTGALAEAEARAAAASAEANAAFRPKVDLPPRAEPRPFPKPPPRRTSPSRPDTAELESAALPIASAPPPAEKANNDATLLTGQKPKPPKPELAAKPALSLKALEDAEPVSAAPVSLEPISAEDDIPIDFGPDVPEPEAEPPATTTTDSGRFDLQQLMSTGPRSAKKGLGDEDLFSIAGDLFSDTSPPNLSPPDLGVAGRPAAPPRSASRLLAPVAMGTAPDRAPDKPRSVVSTPAVVAPVEAPRPTSRSFAPWLLLPVLAAGAAAIMVWQGRSPDPGKETVPTVVTTQQGQREPAPTVTQPAPPVTVADTGSTTTSTAEPKDPPKPSETSGGNNAAWKPPTPTTGAPPGTSPTPTPTSPATTPVATQPPPAATSSPPAPAGNEFNTAAAKAALRNAAGAASACPSEKPGVASVAITFAPSGRVTSSQVSGSFAGTTTGGCIASAMRSATVPPFEGGPVSVSWKVTIR